MRKMILIVSFMLTLFNSFAGCGDCDDSQLNLTATAGQSLNLIESVNQISADQGCDKGWEDRYEFIIKINNSYSALTNLVESGGLGFTAGILNYDLVLQQFVYSDPALMNSLSITIHIDVIFDSGVWGWCDHGVNRSYDITLYHAGSVQINPNVLCSGKEYQFNEIVTSSPSSHLNKTVTFSTGDQWVSNAVTFTQPLNSIQQITYAATMNGYNVTRTWTRPIHELKIAEFVSTAQTAGPITSQSASSLMMNYVNVTGGIPEFSGSGLVNNGGNMWFDPSVANIGNNVMFIRTNNNGCISDWEDTVFYVTPIVTSINVPILNLPAAFGSGENGIFYVTNSTGTPTISSSGKFHFGCSNRDYVFSLNTYQTGVTYEWKVMYQNIVYTSGMGNTFTVSMPDRSAVNRNVSSSVYSIEDILGNPNYLFNTALAFGNGVDVTGDGTYNSDDQLTTVFTGDEMKVMCRGVNVFGATSDWGHVLVGVVPSPELENNSVLCYDQNPILTPVTSTELYLDSIDYDKVRSVIWDINNDGVYELDGSVDSILQLMVTNQKSDLMISQIIDSTNLYAYNNVTGEYYEYYYPQAGEVCVSVVDTVRLVRNPIVNVAFNVLDTIQIGTPVRGVASGTWFSVEDDSIVWNWSDGSMAYFTDTNWHYLNDLGDHSLNVTVVDSFGCESVNSYTNFWYVPGVLSETELDKTEVNIYPVPVVDMLTIETNNIIEKVIIVDMNGKEVLVTSDKIIDLSHLMVGGYFVQIFIENELITKKIIKQ